MSSAVNASFLKDGLLGSLLGHPQTGEKIATR
jgi:hypothetical protein